jgi:O-antigen/teichoic acid export membrane protein
MTRLLFPDAFGVVAAATALIVGLALLSDFGVRTVIIQSPNGEDSSFLRTGWTFQCLRGLLLWLILAPACALLYVPEIHSFLTATSVFADPSFPAVAIAQGLNLVLGGTESTAIPLNVRRLNFKPIVILDMTAKLVPIPIMIAWAYALPSVWPIVAGGLIGSLLRTLLSHAIIPGPGMRFEWQSEHIKEIVHLGKWINLSSLATFVGSQSDIIIMGLLLSTPVLGIYYIAKTISDAIEALLERLNSSMTLPVLGQVIRKNPENLKDRYYRFRLPIELVAAGAAGFLFAAGESIITLLYDQRYAEAGLMLKVLSFALLLYPFQLIRSGFTAAGRANIVAWVSVLQAASLVTCLTLGYHFYADLGAIAGVAVSRVPPSLAMLALSYQANWMSMWKELRWVPIYAAGFMLGQLVVYALKMSTLAAIRPTLW